MAVRDPIHGWIKFTELEQKLIDAPLMQRLRRVKQLTTVDLVYTGGNGSRFEHSLGAMHIAGLYGESAFRNFDSDTKQHLVTLVRVAALMHDIGHGPFSHSFDRSVYTTIYKHDPTLSKSDGHDIHRHYIIRNDPKILQALRGLHIEPDWISAVWNAHSDQPLIRGDIDFREFLYIMSAIVQGPMGADRIDFTMRDSYYTGMTHLGTIAHTRIMDHARATYTEHGWRLTYSVKTLEDMLHALDGRQYMYRNVYLHKTCIAGSILIERIMENMTKLTNFKDRVMDLDQFIFLTDSIVMEPLQMTDSKLVSETKELVRRYLSRDLPKLEVETQIQEHQPEPALIDTYRDDPDYAIDITRIINGMDCRLFDKYSIYFTNHTGALISCQDALTSIGYTVPQQPYKLVRVYRMNPYVDSDDDD